MRARAVADNALLVLRGKTNLGYCSTCEHRTVFIEKGPWLRDEYLCRRCRSIPRWRALSRVLDEQFPEWPTARIHEASPDGAASARLRRRGAGYTYSQFDVPGEPHEDLEALSFDDDSIDLFITQDVFEHVLRPAAGFSEIARVLRPGGAHVFTVPMFQRDATVVRVDEGGRELMEPDFHGGPQGPSLVIREWGRDLLDFIEESSGMKTDVYRFHDKRRGLLGEFPEVFVSRSS